MYKVSVPIMNFNVERAGREALAEEIKKFGASRVWLAMRAYHDDEKQRERDFRMLRENTAYFKAQGFEVGAWYWSFMVPGEHNYTKMVSLDGKPVNFICPFDKDFLKLAVRHITDVAESGVDMIQFDDDFRFSLLGAEPCCVCDHHIKRINEKTGDSLTREELCEKILLGEDNKYRQAWVEANGESLVGFAKEMRDAVDKVNPKIRIGVCSCTSSWDIDGGRTKEIDRILAGENKPFRRLIMAPYWAASREWGNKLQNVIELERMESLCCDDDVEVIGEGDPYPRPRTNCPASYLEIFDTALRADGGFDGILKYGLDYYSTAEYEKGYALRHIKNKDLYAQIDKYFGDKELCGVRIYENPDKITGSNFEEKGVMNGLFFTPSAHILSENSIPTIWSGEGVFNMALGDNIKIMPEEEMKKGVIIDAKAARILIENGVDVGCEFLTDKHEVNGITERFEKQKEYVNHLQKIYAYDVSVKEGADVLSNLFEDEECLGKPHPAVYIYTNDKGYKFFVFTFNFKSQKRRDYCFYARSREIADGIKALTGNSLPAYSCGNPDLYIMTKKKSGAMAVGLWNCFADIIYDAVVELDKEYSEVSFINCGGRLEGDRVYIEEIPAFGIAGFEVK